MRITAFWDMTPCKFPYKVKYLPITCHGGTEREQKRSSTYSHTRCRTGVGRQRHAPAVLPPGKGPGSHCTGGWVGLGVSDKIKSLSPTTVRTPIRSARSESLYRLSHSSGLLNYINGRGRKLLKSKKITIRVPLIKLLVWLNNEMWCGLGTEKENKAFRRELKTRPVLV